VRRSTCWQDLQPTRTGEQHELQGGRKAGDEKLTRTNNHCHQPIPMQQGQVHFEAGEEVGWDQGRFAAPTHHEFTLFHDGGPTLGVSWAHPSFNKKMGLPMQGFETATTP
jgi:hypothetical protein